MRATCVWTWNKVTIRPSNYLSGMIQFQKSKKNAKSSIFLVNQGGTGTWIKSGLSGLCHPGRSSGPTDSILSECTIGFIFILVDMYPEYYEKRDFEPPLESARARFLAQLDDGEGYQWWKLHILWLWCVFRINFEFKWILISFYERFSTVAATQRTKY